MPQTLNILDIHLIRLLNQYAGLNPALDHLIYTLSDSGLLKGGLFMAFLWWHWFRRDDATETRRGQIIIALGATALAVIVSRILQVELPFRDRPMHNAALHFMLPDGVGAGMLDGWSSFPSDHAVLFSGLAVAVWIQSWRGGLLCAIWALVAVCLPRVYLGYHYPTDIAAGLILGTGVVVAAHLLFSPDRLTAPLLRWEHLHPTSFYCLAFLASFELAVMFRDIRQLTADGIHLASARAATTLATEGSLPLHHNAAHSGPRSIAAPPKTE